MVVGTDMKDANVSVKQRFYLAVHGQEWDDAISLLEKDPWLLTASWDTGFYSMPTLHLLVCNHASQKAVEYLLAKGADVNQTDGEGMTALNYAENDVAQLLKARGGVTFKSCQVSMYPPGHPRSLLRGASSVDEE